MAWPWPGQAKPGLAIPGQAKQSLAWRGQAWPSEAWPGSASELKHSAVRPTPGRPPFRISVQNPAAACLILNTWVFLQVSLDPLDT